MKKTGLSLLVVMVAVANAIPVQQTQHDNEGQVLLQGVPYDTRVCQPSVSQAVHDAMHSEQGKAAECPACLDIAMHFEESGYTVVPGKEAACRCTRAIAPLLPFIRDAEYDCVLTKGLWNVAELAKECLGDDVSQAEQDAAGSKSTEVVVGHACEEGVTCINGRCENDKCVCTKGQGGFQWAPAHPLFVGDDCTIPWCKNDCSGHGSCNTDTGLCVCDSNFVGLACDSVHNPTKIAESHAGVMEGSGGLEYNGDAPCFKALYALPLSHPPTVHTPQCDEAGEWVPVQCNEYTKRCWCVDKEGTELKGSSRDSSTPPTEKECRGFLDGGEFAGIGKGLAQPPSTDDPCGNTFCSGNGFCNPSEQPVQCHCIGGYSGDTCNEPPSN